MSNANPCTFDLVAADLLDLLAMADAAPADCTAAPAHALVPVGTELPRGVRRPHPRATMACVDYPVAPIPRPKPAPGRDLLNMRWSRWD